MLTHDNVLGHRRGGAPRHPAAGAPAGLAAAAVAISWSRPSALFYALTVGADILYVRSRNPRVIFEAIRDHRVTTMVVVPQVLDLFWSAIEREVDEAGRDARPSTACAASPGTCPTRPAGSCSGGSTPGSAAGSTCSCPPARSCRRPSSRHGRTSASS